LNLDTPNGPIPRRATCRNIRYKHGNRPEADRVDLNEGTVMRVRTPLVVAATAATMIAGSTLPAMAAKSGNTDTTFTLSGGSLAITVQPTAHVGTKGASGILGVDAALGNVTVTDTSGGVAAWTATASSSQFLLDLVGTETVHDSGSTSTAVLYTSTMGAIVGTVTPSAKADVDAIAGGSVVTTVGVSGNNTVTWAGALAVTIPSTARAGDYTATVATSVA
jgi:hypothetical protein